ncbi:hypothetical protein HJC23_006873 [Cyclotella cryptica]|uniref:Uncharacterized protein n=1 Tax=Cyclotella cryptica TaxID=29204 RepID=A0ABD3QIN0_9STRA
MKLRQHPSRSHPSASMTLAKEVAAVDVARPRHLKSTDWSRLRSTRSPRSPQHQKWAIRMLQRGAISETVFKFVQLLIHYSPLAAINIIDGFGMTLSNQFRGIIIQNNYCGRVPAATSSGVGECIHKITVVLHRIVWLLVQKWQGTFQR